MNATGEKTMKGNEEIIIEHKGYMFTQEELANNYRFKIYKDGSLVKQWEYNEDIRNYDERKLRSSYSVEQFCRYFAMNEQRPKGFPGGPNQFNRQGQETFLFEDYNKSDTLVIHLQDATTDSLGQVYEGKNYDVIHDGRIDKETLHQLMKSHPRIIVLGHGCPYGLMNPVDFSLFLDGSDAIYFKDKKLFVIWCGADEYFSNYNIGHGQFITGNIPSDPMECWLAGCGKITEELMTENITYWGKLCADVAETALNGNPQEAVDYIRKNYIAKYGDSKITHYNAERTKVQP